MLRLTLNEDGTVPLPQGDYTQADVEAILYQMLGFKEGDKYELLAENGQGVLWSKDIGNLEDISRKKRDLEQERDNNPCDCEHMCSCYTYYDIYKREQEHYVGHLTVDCLERSAIRVFPIPPENRQDK